MIGIALRPAILAVTSEGGSIISFAGDGIFVVFPGSSSTARAHRAAETIRTAFKRSGQLRTSLGPVRLGLKQVSDVGALEAALAEVIAASPKQVEQYRAGKTALKGYFVGQVMKKTRGQANPKLVSEIVERELGSG